MVLNIPTVNVSGAACADCPTIGVVLGGDTGIGGEAQIAGSTALGSVAVVDNNALIGVVLCDCGTGCCGGLDESVITAGCVRDGLSFPLVLIGEASVMSVIRCNKQYVGGTGILIVIAVSLYNNNLLFSGDGFAGNELVAEPVVVRAIHAVNREEESVLGDVGEAVLIDEGSIQCCLIYSIDDIGAGCVCFDSSCFCCIDSCPGLVELCDLLCFVCRCVNTLSKGDDGNESKNQNERKSHSQYFASFHWFSSLKLMRFMRRVHHLWHTSPYILP